MKALSNIDSEKSIRTGRIIVKRDRLEKIDLFTDIITWILLCLGLSICAVVIYFNSKPDSISDQFLSGTLMLCVLAFSSFGIYRKLTENRLISIETSYSREINRKLILKFLTSKGYGNIYEHGDVVLVDYEESILGSRIITFIVDHRQLYFTIVNDYRRFNPPVFLSHRLLKSALRKFIEAEQYLQNHASR